MHAELPGYLRHLMFRQYGSKGIRHGLRISLQAPPLSLDGPETTAVMRSIDWKAGEITVASRRGAHTKNYASRTIPMNDALVDYLQRHSPVLVRISGHMTKSPYVFSRPNGKPYTDVRDSLRAAAHRAGIEGDVKLQLLRHCFCSHSLMQGADPRSLQRWMGHRDLRTTMGYSHTSPDHEKAAMQRLRYDHGHNTVTMASES